MTVNIMSSKLARSSLVIFFFQAEDGIRDYKVTGVQTWCSSDLRRRERCRPGAGQTPAGFRSGRNDYGRPGRNISLREEIRGSPRSFAKNQGRHSSWRKWLAHAQRFARRNLLLLHE